MGGGLHDRPAVGGRVHGLPRAELLRGHPRPALCGHGPEALPAHARHGHDPLRAPGCLQHLLRGLRGHQASHVNLYS